MPNMSTISAFTLSGGCLLLKSWTAPDSPQAVMAASTKIERPDVTRAPRAASSGSFVSRHTAQRFPAYVAVSTSIDAQSTKSVLLRANNARPNWAQVIDRKSTNATVSTLAWFVQRSFRQQQPPSAGVVVRGGGFVVERHVLQQRGVAGGSRRRAARRRFRRAAGAAVL